MAGNKRDYDYLASSEDRQSLDDPLVTVSVLIPGEDAKKYLMQLHGDRGWWIPFGRVLPNETIKICAQRVASVVRQSYLGSEYRMIVALVHCDEREPRKEAMKYIIAMKLLWPLLSEF